MLLLLLLLLTWWECGARSLTHADFDPRKFEDTYNTPSKSRREALELKN